MCDSSMCVCKGVWLTWRESERGEHCVSEINPLKCNSVSGKLHLVRLHTPATERREGDACKE